MAGRWRSGRPGRGRLWCPAPPCLTGWPVRLARRLLTRRVGRRRVGRDLGARHKRKRQAKRGGLQAGVARVRGGGPPVCRARTRAGSLCLGLAMANGRRRKHCGAGTGPRTPESLARMVAAKTAHGRFTLSGAPKRLAQRCVPTLIVGIGLACAAALLPGYLPAGMAAQLVAAPEELRAPKHPSQVAFEALSPLTPSNCLPPGLWRRARAALARLRMGGGMVVGMPAVALCGRETGRLAARAEAAAQAPWQAAIAAACGLKRAMAGTRGQTRDTRNDPIRGTGGQTPGVAQRPYTRRGRPNWGNVQRPYTRRRRAIPRGVAQRPYTRPLRARRCGGGRAGAAATRMRDTGAAPPSPLIRFAAQPLRSRTLVRSSRPKPAKSGRGKGVIQGLRPVFS